MWLNLVMKVSGHGTDFADPISLIVVGYLGILFILFLFLVFYFDFVSWFLHF